MSSEPKKYILAEIEDGGMDAGLMMFSLATPRGVTRSLGEIAEVCDCKKQTIWNIEKRALAKLKAEFERRRLQNF